MARFDAHQPGLRALERGREMGEAMASVARNVGVPAFQAAAPVLTGDLRRNVSVELQTSDSGLAGAALVLRPDSDEDPNAPVSIIFGTVDTPEHDALQRAREAMERG